MWWLGSWRHSISIPIIIRDLGLLFRERCSITLISSNNYQMQCWYNINLLQRPADIIKRKRPFAVWFPYTTIERLLYKLEELIKMGHMVDHCDKLKKMLYSSLQNHLKIVSSMSTFLSNFNISSAWHCSYQSVPFCFSVEGRLSRCNICIFLITNWSLDVVKDTSALTVLFITCCVSGLCSFMPLVISNTFCFSS